MPDRERPAYPAGARIAGIIWIGVGILGLIASVISIAAEGAAANRPNRPQASNPTGSCCGVLFYSAFLAVGIQTVRGSATSLTGNGVGSIVFSLLMFAVGGFALFMGFGAPPQGRNADPTIFLITGIVVFGLGGLLLIAGILGINSNTAYKEWRKAEGLDRPARGRRREDDDDDYDDRDSRRRREDDDDRPSRRRDEEGDDRRDRPRRDDD